MPPSSRVSLPMILFAILGGFVFATAPAGAEYHFESYAPASRASFSGAQRGILEKLNRRDNANLEKLDSVVVPDLWVDDELEYSPLPRTWYSSPSIVKILVVDQRLQAFGAYDSGRLVRWGPVSSGRKNSPTPTGVFHLNWKARSWKSTVDTTWILDWYFNLENSQGVSLHAYDLPGYPASHACIRLLDRDAEWLYGWGDAWRLSRDGQRVLLPGTPVLILGVAESSIFKNPQGKIR